MAQQKQDEFEDEDEDGSKFKLDFINVLTVLSLIIISELFLYFLSVKTDSSFGLKEIVFGIFSGIVMSLFLIWVRFIMASNKYLGGIISLVGMISIVYALTRKYQGTYTTIFMSIAIVIGLFYSIFYFVKAGKK
ncbi:MAG: hypothetical protein AABW89_03740 [Nanoarchaeota archaeon]